METNLGVLETLHHAIRLRHFAVDPCDDAPAVPLDTFRALGRGTIDLHRSILVLPLPLTALVNIHALVPIFPSGSLPLPLARADRLGSDDMCLEPARIVSGLSETARHVRHGTLASCSRARHHRAILEHLLALRLALHRLGVFQVGKECLLVRIDDILLVIVVVEPVRSELLLLRFEGIEFREDVRVDKVRDILPVQDLRDDIMLPLVLREQVVLLRVHVEHTGPALLRLDIALETAAHRVLWVVLDALLDGVGDERRSYDVVARFGLCDVDAVDDAVDLGALELVLDAMCEQLVACGGLHVVHAFVGVAGDVHGGDVGEVDDFVDECAVLGCQVFETADVNFVEYDEGGLVDEERFDGVEEFALRESGVSDELGHMGTYRRT